MWELLKVDIIYIYRCECANGYVVAPGNPRQCLDSDECQLVSQSV